VIARRRVELGKHVLDKEIVDADGLRCGKVDDLVLDVPDDGSGPTVRAILTGPLAFAGTLGAPAVRVARVLYRLVGLRAPKPVEIAWDHVAAIDVVVHLDLHTADTEVQTIADHARRLVARVPGA